MKAVDKYMNGKKGRPFFLAATAPWCGHCQRLYPTLVELSNNANSEFLVATFNADKHSQELQGGSLGLDKVGLALKQVIQGYPTLLMFDGKGKAAVYQGPRDPKSMKDAMNNFINN
jgi:protein disulfide-isomerase A1